MRSIMHNLVVLYPKSFQQAFPSRSTEQFLMRNWGWTGPGPPWGAETGRSLVVASPSVQSALAGYYWREKRVRLRQVPLL